jgi:hypothetical protein
MQDIDKTATCAISGDSLVVNRTVSGYGDKIVIRRNKEFRIQQSVDDRFAVTVDNGEANYKCDEQGTKAVLARRFVNRLDASIEFSRDYSRTVTQGEKLVKSDTVKVTGQRRIKRTVALESPGVFIIDTAFGSKVSRKVSFTTAKSGNVKMQSTVETPEDSNLGVVHTVSQGQRLKTVINSPKIVATDGLATIESSYENVTFAQSSGCMPESGKISGKVFNNDDPTTPIRTFTIDFSQNTPQIDFGGGEAYDYVPGLCDFEDAN